MKINEEGYITDISTAEAVAMLNGVFMDAGCARQNGKSRLTYNYMFAWQHILSTLKDGEII